MKTAFLSRLAAVLLAAPLAAAVVATPAAAEHRDRHAAAAAAAPVIDRLVLSPDGPIVAGQPLRFRLVGTPGGEAFLDVPGWAPVEMTETRPGVYQVTITLEPQDDLSMLARVTARLRSHGRQAFAPVEVRNLDAQYGWGRDNRPPEISNMLPAQGDRVQGWRGRHIAARMSDDRSGIDPSSVRLLVDGRDVTRLARIDHDSIDYHEQLARGRHTAELIVRDRAGNTARKWWSFEVSDGDRYGYGYGSYGLNR